MITFFLSLVILVAGYVFYGKFVEGVLGVDPSAQTPAVASADGIDYVPMSWPRIFLIQFLNIAGLGPIYGAIAGALWGPAAFLWIVFGSIFAGAVHDYFSGMLSIKHNGASIPELVGIYLGGTAKQIMRVFTVVLLILVGTVFMVGPAELLAALTPNSLTVTWWLAAIILYYFLATILPVDKIIGRFYPLFGAALLIMAVGITGGLVFGGYQIPELALTNLHPKGLPLWPLLFITISCGAISGFHATQSPLMARCVQNETQGRKIFYGSMIAEGMIALIWAAAAMTFFNGTEGLQTALANGGPGAVVHIISTTLLGKVGGLLAVLGVIACPITSGDTAFRSARLAIADAFKFEQKPIIKRLALALPLIAVGFLISQVDFSIIWRYFAWSNQTLAMMMLWTASAYLAQEGKLHWITTIPATFMSAVTVTYILQAPEGFHLATSISYPLGFGVAAAALGIFLVKFSKKSNTHSKKTIAK
ncbi:carbon starvation protein A [Metallumcola ferriviriculae]|uniref:Carbon starvation protein A n=1 Tax=Metallumcola ferriviriculae TaxID=3039180 RepID=A0AAU0UKS5_9FIRM|nr:carbon starvation protein A [Desulfitibacteraceae bacterium MK1]